MAEKLKCDKHGSYRQPGRYVAVCNNGNFDGHYIRVFDFPKDNLYCGRKEDYAEMGVTAEWFFLNRVNHTACLDRVYPLEIFDVIVSPTA